MDGKNNNVPNGFSSRFGAAGSGSTNPVNGGVENVTPVTQTQQVQPVATPFRTDQANPNMATPMSMDTSQQQQPVASDVGMGAAPKKAINGRVLGFIIGALVLIGGAVALVVVLLGKRIDYSAAQASVNSAASSWNSFASSWDEVMGDVQGDTTNLEEDVARSKTAYADFQASYSRIGSEDAVEKDRDVKAKFDTLSSAYSTYDSKIQRLFSRIDPIVAMSTVGEDMEPTVQETLDAGGTLDDAVDKMFAPFLESDDEEFVNGMMRIVELEKQMVNMVFGSLTSSNIEQVANCEGIENPDDLQKCMDDATTQVVDALQNIDQVSLEQIAVEISQIIANLLSPVDSTPVTTAITDLQSLINSKVK